MSEESSKRKGIIALAALVVVGGGVVWYVNSGSSEPVPDEIAEKANRLTQQAAEAEDQRTADQVDMPEPDDSGIEDMRGGG